LDDQKFVLTFRYNLHTTRRHIRQTRRTAVKT